MTNRFRFHTKDNTSMVYDTENEVYYFCIDLNDICDLLNALHKENEQLKQTNQELYDKLQLTMSEKSLKGGEVSILKRENEELKQENKKLADALTVYFQSKIKGDFE